MKKDKEWLKEELMGLKFKISEIGKVRLGEVFELVDQLDEPTKPVIPQFMANWIESYRKKTLVELINDAVYSSDEDSKCFRRWFHEEMGSESNYSEFISRTWLDGYEVEKEKVYIIKFAPSIYGTPTYGAIGTQSGKKIMQSIYGSQEGLIVPNQYTRREIEEVGRKYMIFAEEVTE